MFLAFRTEIPALLKESGYFSVDDLRHIADSALNALADRAQYGI